MMLMIIALIIVCKELT